MNENIPGLKIETNDDGTITLEQDWCGNVDRVAIHPIHLRHMAECLGLVSTVSASDAELLRNLARYKRALLTIRERAEQLYKNVFGLSQLGHEDMGVEVAQAAALADFAEHICIEFENDFAADPRPLSAADADKSGTRAGQKADKKSAPGKGGEEQQRALTLEQRA